MAAIKRIGSGHLVYRVALLLGLAAEVLSVAGRARAQVGADYDEIGPIDVQTRYQRPAVAVYVELARGDRFQVLATHEDEDATSYERYDTRLPIVVLRVAEPDEQLLYYRVIDTAVGAADYPELAAEDLAEGVLANAELRADAAGIYTIRMSAGYEHSKLWLGLPSDTSYAVSYGNGVWQDWRTEPGPLWLWIPRDGSGQTTVEFRHQRGAFTVWGPEDSWSQTLSAEGQFSHTLPPGDGGELWRLDGLSSDWQLRAGGDVPVIAATTARMAETLNASLLPIDSGPLAGRSVPHRFQKHLAEQVVPALLERVDDGSELTALLDDVLESDACTTASNPETARQAIGLVSRDLPALRWTLDHWRFGSAATSHPFADVDYHYSLTPVLAWLYTYVHPCNPWGPSTAESHDGRTELIVRATLAAMTHLLDITEDERLSTGGDAWSNYPGGTNAFQIGDRAWPLAMLAPRVRAALPAPLSDDVLAVHTEGVRRLAIDRRYADYIVSARNQSAFYVPTMGAIALNRDEPLWETIARAYAERFAASADPAGWFPESLGPDATYNGITNAELAHYYVMSAWMPGCSDPNIRAALRKSYTFFNATVAPEPAGGMLGGFNFSHRTNWGFYAEQFGGARSRARDIPEVAIWSSAEQPSLEELQSDLSYAVGQFENRVDRTPDSVSTHLARFLTFVASHVYHYPESHAQLSWPAENGATDQLFDDDLYVVRRRSFYAVAYVGHPIHDTFYTDKKVPYMLRATPPADGCPALHIATYEDTGLVLPGWNETLCPGDEYPTFGHVHPFVGGGLTLVWTPAMGAGLLGANWSPLVHHGVVGQRTSPSSGAVERTWERYAATMFNGASRDSIDMAGTIPAYYGATEEIDYVRRYNLTDDHIMVEVTLTNNTPAPQSFDALWENIPAPVCAQDCDNNRKRKPVGFAASDGTALDEGDHTLDAVHIVDDAGHGLAVELSGGARLVSVRPVGMILQRYSTQLQIGRIQIPFDSATLAPGESTSLQYRLRTLDPVSTVPPVPAVTDDPEILCGPDDWIGPSGDGGTGPGAETSDDGGCGCRSAPRRPPPLPVLVALALWWAFQRRRVQLMTRHERE